jgi:P pilus assembly chaperone PapD
MPRLLTNATSSGLARACNRLRPFRGAPAVAGAVFACALLLIPLPASASMALSKVVVDFASDGPPRDDIEISNPSDETLYVSIEPAEVIDPGDPGERRVSHPDPRELGLLISPKRLVLGPGERKIVRLSLLERPRDRDRIYRVAVKPVVGEIVATRSALKLVVGYDVLVIARPPYAHPRLEVARSGSTVVVRNAGNTNALLFKGRQCEAQDRCVELPSKRVYAGNTWQFELPGRGQGEFLVDTDRGTTVETF